MRLACSIGVIGVAILCAGCSRSTTPQRYTTSAPLDAPELMIQYGCPTCHVVPRVPGAAGKVGPSLEGLDQRSYLAGTLPNSPENLIRWIQHPQQIHPGTAMPEMGVTSTDAARIAAFLQSDH